MTRENGETQCISFEHETYFIHRKFNSLEFCIWQVAQVIQMHATMWLIARTGRSGTGYIFMRAYFPRDCHRLIKWIRDYSLFTNRFDILFFFFSRTDTSPTRKVARTWHFSRCNFYASEFLRVNVQQRFPHALVYNDNRFNQTATKVRVSRG